MIIHLGDETRAEVIDSVLGQLSDGIWENSSAMGKYWMFADVEGTDLVIDDEPFSDEKGWGRYGSTIKRTQNGFAGKSEKQIKDWFANKAKQVVKIWAEDCSKDPNAIWDRANDDDVVDYMGGHRVRTITVADVYECYDFLKGRSGKKYGIAANPLPYEVEGSTRRTFTKYPSNYVQAGSSTDTKVYTSHGFKFFVENSCIVLEEPDGEQIYVDDIPACLITNPAVRKAMYLAHNNSGGDVDLDTVSSILYFQASLDTLIKIDRVLEKNGYPILSEL